MSPNGPDIRRARINLVPYTLCILCIWRTAVHLMRKILRVTINETRSRFFRASLSSLSLRLEPAPLNAATTPATRRLRECRARESIHRHRIAYGIDAGNFICVYVEKIFAEKVCARRGGFAHKYYLYHGASRGENEWVIYRRCYRMCDMRTCACQPCVGTREDNWIAVSMNFAFPQTGYLV